MNIIPELNLNKTPNNIKSYSIVGAKNIVIDDTGSYITNEDGFKIEFETESNTEQIVGCIPCNNEIVIFTDDGINSYIYRKRDNEIAHKIKHNWKWSGGKLVGDYTYNYKNQLVIILGEYGVDNKKIPLKSWILTDSLTEEDNYLYYNICPNIPKYNVYYDINYNQGSLICGQYTYFIRFKIYENTYTNWFQITDGINIVNLVEKERPVLNYATRNNDGSNYKISQATINEVDEYIYPVILVNDVNHLSNKSIKLNIDIDINNTVFKEYQLGYIFKRESETFGRIIGNYNINVTSITLADNNYLEEENIDEFFKQPIQFYNVQNVKVYNNRAYIANYEEETNENLGDIHCTAGYSLADYVEIYDFMPSQGDDNNPYEPDEPIDPDDPQEEQIDWNNYNINLNIQHKKSDGTTTQYTQYLELRGIESYKQGEDIYIKNPKEFVENYIASNIPIKDNIRQGNYTCNSRYIINYDNTEYKFYFIIRIGSFYDSNYIEIFNNSLDANTPAFKIKVNEEDKTLTFITENNSISIGNNIGFGVIAHYTAKDTSNEESVATDYYYNCPSSSRGYFLANRNGQTSIFNEEMTKAVITCTKMQAVPRRVIGGAVTLDLNVTVNNYFNRTLLPYQAYNFYVHFIRNNGSITPGFKLIIDDVITDLKEFNTITTDTGNIVYSAINNLDEEGKLIIPQFNITIPSNYIGYFISYEALENKVFTAWKIDKTDKFGGSASGESTDELENNSRFNSSAYLYNLASNIGNNVIKNYGYVNGVQFDTLKHINKSTIEKHFKIHPNNFTYNSPYIFYNNNTSIYNKTYKTLYRLTPNIYSNYNESNYSRIYYLPGFYSKEILPFYTEEVIGTITSEYFVSPIKGGSFGVTGNTRTRYPRFYIQCINEYNYSEFPYFALSIKKDYSEATVSFVDVNNNNNPNKGIYYNKAFMPVDIKDFMELQACYYETPLISYTNYNINNIDKFDKTIYRSDVFSDENLNNSFKNYSVDNYKNIFENKGAITNIIPIGLVLLVHTEYGLFAFDRNPKLSLQLKSEIPDTFDTDYQQIFTKSYGGLKNKYHSIVTNFGYIWYDEVNKLIFRYDNGQFKVISTSINNFLKCLNIDDIRFAFDNNHNRLIISITTNNYKIITISYNFNTETFISLHDYYITNCYNTSDIAYIYNQTLSNNKLYSYNNEQFDYKELVKTEDDIFDVYNRDNNIDRYIDIIINDNYEIIKVLETISYILNDIVSDFDIINFKNTVEQNLNKRFSGDKLYIYTDETCTGELNINCDDGHNKLNDYKYPYWDKGKWNFNYFRNTIATTTKPTNSDMQSVIYGKYFVIRFIFNNNRRFKLESIDSKVNIY